jgi:diguanylate cyclase (GGDEF)-like protein
MGWHLDLIDTLNEQAGDLAEYDSEQAAQLFEQALRLAQQQDYSGGQAAALAGLAYLIAEKKPDLAARYCLQALSVLDEQNPIPATISAQFSLGWVQLYLGDYSAAMEWALKALHNSQALVQPNKEADVLDLIASVHCLQGEYAQAILGHERVLSILHGVQDEKREVLALNNMSMSLFKSGDLIAALATAQQSLRLARLKGMTFAQAVANSSVGEILVAMGDFSGAEACFMDAQREALNKPVFAAYLEKDLGQVYLAQKDLPRAVMQIEKALATALRVGLLAEQAECHQLLSGIHEQQCDLAQALDHFKQFHVLKEKIAGEETARRLSLLHVMYEVESARHETEIQRLRNTELQSEIEERKHAQSALEKLASLDSLTGLNNRRHFLYLAEQEFRRSQRYQHALAVVIFDLDHFKLVNDTFGHPVGDQVLVGVAARIKSVIREVDIAGRIGGEEFALVLPETTLNGAGQVAGRICCEMRAEPIISEAGPVKLTASAGVASLMPGELPAVASFDILLLHADRALYAAKRAGRNQVQFYIPAPGDA